MDQKNRLLREAHAMLSLIAEGLLRPLASANEAKQVRELRDRIAKNMKLV